MAKIIYISGGQRSGKSSYAQDLALNLSTHPIYLATSRVWDEDFAQRIKRHQADRGEEWENIEEEKNIDTIELPGRVVLLDCITLWLTNIFHDNDYDLEASLQQAKTIWDSFVEQEMTLIVVSNELGMGMHAETPVGRKFQDLQGWINQHIAKQSDQAILMVSGIPVTIKEEK